MNKEKCKTKQIDRGGGGVKHPVRKYKESSS